MRKIFRYTNNKEILNLLVLVFCILMAISTHVQAEDKDKDVDIIYSKILHSLPQNSTLVAVPYADALNAYGQKAKGKVNEQSTIPGGKSYQVDVKKVRILTMLASR